jgi:hypothetical protein
MAVTLLVYQLAFQLPEAIRGGGIGVYEPPGYR